MAGEIHYQVEGLEEIKARLAQLKQSLRKKILRRALGKAARLVAKVAKSLAPVSSGAVKKALGSKVYSKKNVVGLIGARTGFEQIIDGKKVDPVRTTHFAEAGRKEVRAKGKPLTFELHGKLVRTGRVRAAQGSRFLARAYKRTRSEVAKVVAEDIAEQLTKVK